VTYKVLIVDDDPDVRTALMREFREPAWAVETAVDGAAGIAALERSLYDVVVIDMVMEHETAGMDVLGKVVALPPSRGTQAIMLTAYGTEVAAFRAGSMGAYGWLPKRGSDTYPELLNMAEAAAELARSLSAETSAPSGFPREHALLVGLSTQAERARCHYDGGRPNQLSQALDQIAAITGRLKELLAHQ
jgi:DNA-binding NtrC family response regulator